ncbi:MAG: SPFH domain-containing protein [Myxococcota bacterium]
MSGATRPVKRGESYRPIVPGHTLLNPQTLLALMLGWLRAHANGPSLSKELVSQRPGRADAEEVEGGMGIFDFVTKGVREILVQRPDEHKDRIVYKHPESTLPNWSQLTVDADEAAVFFRDGSIIGTLRTAGSGQRHTLSSENIPFLGRLIDRVTGSNVFLTDLFFVTMKPVYDVRFGDSLGYMEDPMLGEMVTPRIYGSMALQIVDPERFIVNYVGVNAPGENAEVTKWIAGVFMNSVTSVIGEVCISEQKSLLQLMPLQNRLAEAFLQRSPSLENIGVRIVEIGQFRINLSAEDEERLKSAQAELGAAKRAARVANIGVSEAQALAQQRQFKLDQDFGNDARYVQQLAQGNFGQFAAGKAMIGAGEGMAQGGSAGDQGGAMMAGAGLGAGFGVASAFQGAFQQGPAPQQPIAPPAAGASSLVSCAECGADVPPGKFCSNCGAQLAVAPKFCPACGTQGTPGARFCANCGTSFGTPQE